MAILKKYGVGDTLTSPIKGAVIPNKTTPVSYDVSDTDIKSGMKNYTFIEPAEEFRYKENYVGPQTKETGYKLDPISGFLYRGTAPGIKGLNDFYRRHKGAIDVYSNASGVGFEAWKKEHVGAGGKQNPAMDYVINNLNTRYKEAVGDQNAMYVNTNKAGAHIPGVELFNLAGFEKIPTTPITASTPTNTTGQNMISNITTNKTSVVNENSHPTVKNKSEYSEGSTWSDGTKGALPAKLLNKQQENVNFINNNLAIARQNAENARLAEIQRKNAVLAERANAKNSNLISTSKYPTR